MRTLERRPSEQQSYLEKGAFIRGFSNPGKTGFQKTLKIKTRGFYW
jgi:hypothetical protein